MLQRGVKHVNMGLLKCYFAMHLCMAWIAEKTKAAICDDWRPRSAPRAKIGRAVEGPGRALGAERPNPTRTG